MEAAASSSSSSPSCWAASWRISASTLTSAPGWSWSLWASLPSPGLGHPRCSDQHDLWSNTHIPTRTSGPSQWAPSCPLWPPVSSSWSTPSPGAPSSTGRPWSIHHLQSMGHLKVKQQQNHFAFQTNSFSAFASIMFAYAGASTFPTIQADMKDREKFIYSAIIAILSKFHLNIISHHHFNVNVSQSCSSSTSRWQLPATSPWGQASSPTTSCWPCPGAGRRSLWK